MTKSRENLIEAFNDAKAKWISDNESDDMTLKFVGVQKYDDESWEVFFSDEYIDSMTLYAEKNHDAQKWFDMTPEKFADEAEFAWDDEWTEEA